MNELFDFNRDESIGIVEEVDTTTVIIRVDEDEKLKGLQVNHLLAIQSSKIGQHLIAMVSKIVRKSAQILSADDPDASCINCNIIKAMLIGTHYDKYGEKINEFKRSISTVPSINAECYLITGEKLKNFMLSITNASDEKDSLNIGYYSIDENAPALLNGNKFFQRHAVIVGGTGSGKSWCVAKILEQVSSLKSANAILFDIHGEYITLNSNGFRHFKIAGPNDTVEDGILYLPYWLLTYDEMLSLMLDRSDNNAPNQAMIFSTEVLSEKKRFLCNEEKSSSAEMITVDSPIPYDLNTVLQGLNEKDIEMVDGAQGRPKQGTYFGKLTRFIQRLEAKQCDKRLNFMFNNSSELQRYDYMNILCKKLMSPADDSNGGVKIIDFSEVPSDVLPLMTGLIARLLFSLQQWSDQKDRTPIALFCDEAHLYIPANALNTMEIESNNSFERISKEGRKYGLGLVVISQRPSEVNRTVLSQSNNFIAMRLTNAEDQMVVKRLLPDSLGDYSEQLPILDVGEAIVVGDASLLPCRIKITPPMFKPRSATIEFWDEWEKAATASYIDKAVDSLRMQTKIQ